MDNRLTELHRQFVDLLPGAATNGAQDCVEVGGLVLIRMDDVSPSCQVVTLTDRQGAEVGVSLQTCSLWAGSDPGKDSGQGNGSGM